MATREQLQRKIFSRWCNQKLSLSRDIQVNDVVTEIGDGVLLINLLEVLSETTFPGKFQKNPKMRVHKIDNLNNALKFVWDSGVQMKVKPSAEDLVDGDEKRTLGLIWALMLKFVKFGDDDQLNAKDSLLMWVQNKTQGYKGVSVENFGKDFRDGMALCALVHKHRPKLIDFDSLNPANGKENLQTAMNAAEKYFGLEQYITPEDILKLDENSMVVYVSEYYYGIAEQRKVDLAVRRLNKLIKFTVENDAMRKQYNETAASYKDELSGAEVLLEDRTIDNTMAGAKKRIAEFYEYKQNAKGVLLKNQLELESLFNNLAMRLSHRKRPAYIPPEGVTLDDVSSAMKHLEECERERNVALHQELNRQIILLDLDKQHKNQTSKLETWKNIQQEYLETKEVSTSVGAAQYQLARLNGNDTEVSSVFDTNFSDLKKLGSNLESEKYERTDEVKERENNVSNWFDKLKELSSLKRPILDDDLKRELFRANLRRKNNTHIGKYNGLKAWIEEKEKYLNERENISTIEEAQTHLGILEGFGSDMKTVSETLVSQLNQLGSEILNAKYSSEYSSNVWETPDEIKEREEKIKNDFENLEKLSSEKQSFLDKELEREEKKEELRLKYAAAAGSFTRFIKNSIDKLSATHFGFNLEETESKKQELDQEDSSLNSISDEKLNECNTLFNDGKELGVTENVYASQSPDDLKNVKNDLENAISSRRESYEKELSKQRENDALCKKFADLVNPFSEWINEQKSTITNSDKSLSDQLSFVNDRLEKQNEESSSLSEISNLQNEIDSKEITNNRHTSLNSKDCHVQWDQWISFLNTKQKMLQEAIEHDKLRGISQEEYQEIEENFAQFDKNSSGSLEQKELRACLYSLGQELPSSKIQEIMEKYGNDNQIPLSGFKEFMINLIGDSDTIDEILAGWKLINRDDSVAYHEKMDLVMDSGDVEYVEKTAPAVDGGWDYNAWTKDVFSR